MPELPEVETIKRGLHNLILNQVFVDVEHNNYKSFPNSPLDVKNFLIGSTVIKIRRRAKILIMDLSTEYSLVIHLKMTGQLVFNGRNVHFGAGHPSDSLISELPDRSTRVIFSFSDESKLFFNDQRKFGWVRMMPTKEIENLEFFKKVGPEPLTKEFNWMLLAERLSRRKNSTIKAALLDQSIIAGVGNIYADESLWAAKINPRTLVKNISDIKIKALHNSLQAVLRFSIEQGGSSDRNYVDAQGKKGGYLYFANVFRKEGQSCPRCESIIVKQRVACRGTHICLRCQRFKATKIKI